MKYPCNSNLWKESYRVPQTCNLDGIPMNIYEENSTRNFRVQSESEWTFVLNLHLAKFTRFISKLSEDVPLQGIIFYFLFYYICTYISS